MLSFSMVWFLLVGSGTDAAVNSFQNLGSVFFKLCSLSRTAYISLLAKIFSELAQGCARLYNQNKTKSCKCYKPRLNFDKFDFMVLKKLLQVYTSWQK